MLSDCGFQRATVEERLLIKCASLPDTRPVPGVRCSRWTGMNPQGADSATRQALCSLLEEFSRDVPSGALIHSPETWSLKRLGEAHCQAVEVGTDVWWVLAHGDKDELVGATMLTRDATDDRAIAHQGPSVVTAGWRRRGVARLLKTVAYTWLSQAHSVRRVHTSITVGDGAMTAVTAPFHPEKLAIDEYWQHTDLAQLAAATRAAAM